MEDSARWACGLDLAFSEFLEAIKLMVWLETSLLGIDLPVDAHPSFCTNLVAGVEHETSDRPLTISMTREASNQVLAQRSVNLSWRIASATNSCLRAATSGIFPDKAVQRVPRRSQTAAQTAATRNAEQCPSLPVLYPSMN